jgi:hypothetical protein
VASDSAALAARSGVSEKKDRAVRADALKEVWPMGGLWGARAGRRVHVNPICRVGSLSDVAGAERSRRCLG